MQKLNIQYIPEIDNVLQVIYEDVKTNFSLDDVANLSLKSSKRKGDSFNFIPFPGEPMEESPYYFICDIEKARETAAQYFQCDSSFAGCLQDKGKSPGTKSE